LSGILTDSSNKLRILKLTNTNYAYNFIVPICGSIPSKTNSYDFSVSSIWQNDRKSVTKTNYYLGNYDSDTWEFNNNYLGGSALSVEFPGGEYCDLISGNRTSTVYLLCNKQYPVTAPLITITEVSTCQCELNVEF
jgi:hypothetical protein